EAYEAMSECWTYDPEDRPEFQELTQRIAKLFVPHCSAPVRITTDAEGEVHIREATMREAQAQDENTLYVDIDGYDNELP
ncbi:hypothetical protein SARC_17691, partial [Sphaeroforma arctica JP610]